MIVGELPTPLTKETSVGSTVQDRFGDLWDHTKQGWMARRAAITADWNTLQASYAPLFLVNGSDPAGTREPWPALSDRLHAAAVALRATRMRGHTDDPFALPELASALADFFTYSLGRVRVAEHAGYRDGPGSPLIPREMRALLEHIEKSTLKKDTDHA